MHRGIIYGKRRMLRAAVLFGYGCLITLIGPNYYVRTNDSTVTKQTVLPNTYSFNTVIVPATNRSLMTERTMQLYMEDIPTESTITTKEHTDDKVIIEDTVIRQGEEVKYTVTQSMLDNARKLDMIATAYDLSVQSCGKTKSHPEYGITCSGVRARVGQTVAVDPRVIELGSVLYIVFPEEYEHLNGVYIAEDTGSAVKNNIIDIFMGEDKDGETTIAKAVANFGRRQVDVYIIE